MNMCHACTMGNICNRHIVYCQTFKGESPQGDEHEMCFLGVLEYTFALGWTMIGHINEKEPCLKQCIINQALCYTLPNMTSVRYPN